jgi:hypothetical protein
MKITWIQWSTVMWSYIMWNQWTSKHNHTYVPMLPETSKLVQYHKHGYMFLCQKKLVRKNLQNSVQCWWFLSDLFHFTKEKIKLIDKQCYFWRILSFVRLQALHRAPPQQPTPWLWSRKGDLQRAWNQDRKAVWDQVGLSHCLVMVRDEATVMINHIGVTNVARQR